MMCLIREQEISWTTPLRDGQALYSNNIRTHTINIILTLIRSQRHRV